ncbi:MAG: GNAT family N-acetyltransferase [Alphaproteobacteria bacterium]|nr:GNAT family N-acetyltransferase [Alphaproteobacteria bacterium]
MAGSFTIAPLTAQDEAEWRPLFEAYSRFYKVEPTPEKTATAWRWLMDKSYPLSGLGCRSEGRLIGFAHLRAVPRTLFGIEGGFLDDLFVEPSMRGSGAAMQLIKGIAAFARARQWPVVRWWTADDNYRARNLYDRVARKTNWNTYELDPLDGRFGSYD